MIKKVGYYVLFVIIIVGLALAIQSAITGKNLMQSTGQPMVENFDGTGNFNIGPNWFIKKPYDMKDWLVNVYPDKIQPACLPYNVESKWGSLENMNYNSSAYRYWRF